MPRQHGSGSATRSVKSSLNSKYTRARKRSFGGCCTCRSRHMKCDEERPSCRMCQRVGIRCGGYEKGIFFDHGGKHDNVLHSFRRPLLSETERKHMSERLTACISPKAVLRSIAEIDEACEQSPPFPDSHLSHGPFGAFLARRKSSETLGNENSLALPLEIDMSPPEIDQAEEHELDCSARWSLDDTSSLLPPSRQFSMQGNEVWSLFLDAGEPRGPRGSTGASEWAIHSPVVFPNNALSQTPFGMPLDQICDSRPSFQLATEQPSVPPDAGFLIKYYSTVILSWITPFRHAKTPWHILFVPGCKNCLAALTLDERVDHATLSLFYGILATSAISLGSTSDSPTWFERAHTYWRLTSFHVDKMLENAYDIPKVFKYKTVLMALITMVQISIFLRDQRRTEYYFLEAEKFIRLRGLKRRKSRKVRLLHHCYAFERILYESTVLSETASKHRSRVRLAIQSSGLVITGQDSLSFRMPAWNSLDHAMAVEKSQDEGENDLHLEMPGNFPATLYPEIFGIPEKWVVLISLIIRLGREKDAAKQEGRTNALGAGDFLNLAKEIERRINQLQISADQVNELQALNEPYLVENFRCAMAAALSIYFYRRIYNLESSMLQAKVKTVCDCLVRCEQNHPDSIYGSVRFVWPAFIAACEAEDAETQKVFLSWFQRSSHQSGLLLFSNTWDYIERLWQEKRTSDGKDITWLDCSTNYPYVDLFQSPAFCVED